VIAAVENGKGSYIQKPGTFILRELLDLVGGPYQLCNKFGSRTQCSVSLSGTIPVEFI
jgi:hypothetical protein